MNRLAAEHYHTQLNNPRPYYECGNTSVANVLCSKDYPDDYKNWDDNLPLDTYVYEWLRGPKAQDHAKKIGKWAVRSPEQVPEMLRFCLQELSGIPHKLSYKCKKEDILNNPCMIVATDLYKGNENGHYVMIGGANGKGVLINDPIGNPLSKYKDKHGYNILLKWEYFLDNFHGIAIYS